jgi:hypothetical protein
MASNDAANEVVMASKYYTANKPCPYSIKPEEGRVVWCNPPGPYNVTHAFWARWNAAIHDQTPGAFLFYNMDHMRKAVRPLGDRVVVVLRDRIKYIGSGEHSTTVPSALVFAGVSVDAAKRLELGNVLEWSP